MKQIHGQRKEVHAVVSGCKMPDSDPISISVGRNELALTIMNIAQTTIVRTCFGFFPSQTKERLSL